MKTKISNEELYAASQIQTPTFPKYMTSIINLANRTAQATRPKNIGQLSELFPEFQKQNNSNISVENWKEWYEQKYPNAIEDATDKLWQMILMYKDAIDSIDKKMVEDWIKDLVFNKTYTGFMEQDIILKYIADMKNTTYKHATPEEESKGIDGWIGDAPYQIKPMTYKTQEFLNEKFDCNIVFYKQTGNGLMIEEGKYNP